MNKIIVFCLVIVAAFSAGSIITSMGIKQSYKHLTPEQFKTNLSSGKYILLDVRTADEYSAGHLKNARQTDYYQTGQFSDYLDSLDKNAGYLIYCRTGIRSGKAMQIMQDKGFKDISDMTGGYNAWVAENLPVEK